MEFNKKQFWKWTKKWIPRTLLGYLTITFIWVLVYKWVNPPGTLLMLIKQVESGKGHIYYQWVDDDQISPFIKACSMASEDQNFPDHFGLDIMAIQKAIDFNQKHKRTRGASTITQQVAKNVFLWPGRSIVRKVFELQFTFYIELLWSKKRILEVYLNVIEMGPIIFGVESASKTYFGKSARKLNLDESARIISILPSPLKWSPTRPGPYVQKRKNWIIEQYQMLGGLQFLKEIN